MHILDAAVPTLMALRNRIYNLDFSDVEWLDDHQSTRVGQLERMGTFRKITSSE